MGGVFHIPCVSDVDLIAELTSAKKAGYKVCISAVSGTMPVERINAGPRTVIVFGNEAHGVEPELEQLSDLSIAIPRTGFGESLNVSVACGIILHTIKRNAGIPS